MPNNTHLYLRQTTQTLHAQLDSLPILEGLASGSLSLEGYRSLLLALKRFYQPLEYLLLRDPILQSWVPDLEQRGKVHLIDCDLAFLDQVLSPLSAGELLAHELAGYLPNLKGPYGRLGVLYVMEGATLGGQVIKQSLNRSLGLSSDRGSAFFSSYGPKVAKFWHAFCYALNQTPLNEQQLAQVTSGARDTFSGLIHWLSDWEANVEQKEFYIGLG